MFSVTIAQETDGTFVVQEVGQSPQNLTRKWVDLDAYLRSHFRVHEEPKAKPAPAATAPIAETPTQKPAIEPYSLAQKPARAQNADHGYQGI